MSGFTNDIMNAENVNFTGLNPAEGKVTQDGQLMIGSTAAPNIQIGFLTSLDGSIDVSNGPGTIDISSAASDLHVARFIVASSTNGTGANFTTISAAIAAAQGTGVNCTIWLQPGTYTEDFTLPAGMTLTAATGDASNPNVTIIGKITMTAAGTSTISNIRLRTNSDNCISITGAAAVNLNLRNCFIDIRNNTAILLNNANAVLNLNYCMGDTATTGISAFTVTTGTLNINFSMISNTGASTTASTVAAGTTFIRHCFFNLPLTTTGTGILQITLSRIFTSATNTTALTIGGGSGSFAQLCDIVTGTATAIVVTADITVQNSIILTSNATAISGAGTINFNNISYTTTSAITATTQVPKSSSNDGVIIKTPGAYPYTTVPQDGLILVDTSAARTITPLANPTTGQRHIIKDSVGSAGANPITITPSGKNIDGGASTVINVNYGSVTIIYNGTEWNIV